MGGGGGGGGGWKLFVLLSELREVAWTLSVSMYGTRNTMFTEALGAVSSLWKEL